MSIHISDLAPVVPFTKALLKIDIEGFEDKALWYADGLLDKVFLPHILIEWMSLRKKPDRVIEPLLAWLVSRDYECVDIGKGVKLNFDDWKLWPGNVYFRHQSITQ